MSLEKIEVLLREKGYKLTEQRRLILAILQSNSVPHTAQEVYDLVKLAYSNINFSTIYRNLELMSELGIVDKMNLKSGVSHFEINDREEHHHHVICKGCGETKAIDFCPYKMINNEELDKLGFSATEHKFEIYGFCNKCNAK